MQSMVLYGHRDGNLIAEASPKSLIYSTLMKSFAAAAETKQNLDKLK